MIGTTERVPGPHSKDQKTGTLLVCTLSAWDPLVNAMASLSITVVTGSSRGPVRVCSIQVLPADVIG